MDESVSHASFLGIHPKLEEISTSFAPCSLPHCAGSPVDMHSANIPSECEECVPECDVETCDLATESSQCTDRCLVVPCEDPCPDVCVTACISCSNFGCKTVPCQGFHDFPDHCPVLFPQRDSFPTPPPIHLLMQQDRDGPHRLDWNNASLSRELDALICACATQSQPHSFDSHSCDPRLLSFDRSHAHPGHHQSPTHRSPSVQTSGSGSSTSAGFSPMISASASFQSSPALSSASTSDSHPYPRLGPLESGPRMNTGHCYPQPSSDKFSCLWAECGKSFRSSQDLISHVNATHLHLPIPPGTLPQQISSPQSPHSSGFQRHSGNASATRTGLATVSCMWGDCNVHPTPSRVPGSSTGNVTDAALGMLASHLLQDHLGVSVPHPIASSRAGPGPTLPSENRSTSRFTSFPRAPPRSSAPASHPRSAVFPPQPLASSSSNVSTQPGLQHICKWQHCANAYTTFSSSADLTAHISDAHVGGGKNRYDCMWENCNRYGAAGFSSKQKILRHIQSHTGHRPFQCEICDQFFSEAATLQQHLRRHTKEKPYVCDFPGCDKAFAITGALTIHKRTHSGTKPFKCTYCERSFSESSNLSKHIRTHTGDRPYLCSYPSCEKRFARPDQVARHMNVHNKKKQAGDGVDPDDAADAQEMDVD